MVNEIQVWLPVAIPISMAILLMSIKLIGLGIKPFGFLSKRWINIITPFGFAAALYFAVLNYIEIYTSSTHYIEYSYYKPFGSAFLVTGFGGFIAIVTLVLAILISLYSIDWMKDKIHEVEFFALFSMLIGAMVGVVYSGDFVTLYLFYELMALSSYLLVGHEIYKKEAIEATVKYLFLGSFGSITAFFGIALLYSVTGTLNMSFLIENYVLGSSSWSGIHVIGLVLLISGFSVKSALIPFYTWLPDAHSQAPTPISAILSGMVIKIGMYSLIMSLFVFNFLGNGLVRFILFLVAALTIIISNLIALKQENIKRLLAYSSVYNMGLILIGFAIDTRLGFMAAIFYILVHAISKAASFLCVGKLDLYTHDLAIEKFKGSWKAAPVTAFVMALSIISLIGLPPMMGFTGKVAIILALFQNGIDWITLIVATIFLLFTILAAVYYGNLIKVIWVTPAEKDFEGPGKRTWTMDIALILLGLIVIAITFLPFLIMEYIMVPLDFFF